MRLCRKNPSFTLIVTITLGLGIGATTAIFSVLYATVLAPLPFFEPDRLVVIEDKGVTGRNRTFAPDRLDTWRAQSKIRVRQLCPDQPSQRDVNHLQRSRTHPPRASGFSYIRGSRDQADSRPMVST